MMFDPVPLTLIAMTFLLAGCVKGVIGLGLPTVSLALLTVMIGLQPAMAVLLVPSFVTNVWQAFTGGNGRVLIVRIWPLLVFATLTVWIGATALTRVDVSYLSALLGAVIAIYSMLGLTRPQISFSRSMEGWAGPVVGTVNGILTGMTGSFVFPGVLYLQAIGLPRDTLIQAMGMLFTASTIALGVSLGGHSLLTLEIGIVSAVAVVPAVVGMMLGQRLRKNLSEASFRRVFFLALLTLGFYIISRSLI